MECQHCYRKFSHSPKCANGDPRDIALVGHWDWWQPFSLSVKHSCDFFLITSYLVCPVYWSANRQCDKIRLSQSWRGVSVICVVIFQALYYSIWCHGSSIHFCTLWSGILVRFSDEILIQLQTNFRRSCCIVWQYSRDPSWSSCDSMPLAMFDRRSSCSMSRWKISVF